MIIVTKHVYIYIYIYIRTKITKYTKSIQAWHQINFQTCEMMACDPGNRKT
jgi:hypothetical protein